MKSLAPTKSRVILSEATAESKDLGEAGQMRKSAVNFIYIKLKLHKYRSHQNQYAGRRARSFDSAVASLRMTRNSVLIDNFITASQYSLHTLKKPRPLVNCPKLYRQYKKPPGNGITNN